MTGTIRAAVAIIGLSLTGATMAQQSDVTFFVIGKHHNVQQDSSGVQRPVDFSFFSETGKQGPVGQSIRKIVQKANEAKRIQLLKCLTRFL